MIIREAKALNGFGQDSFGQLFRLFRFFSPLAKKIQRIQKKFQVIGKQRMSHRNPASPSGRKPFIRNLFLSSKGVSYSASDHLLIPKRNSPFSLSHAFIKPFYYILVSSCSLYCLHRNTETLKRINTICKKKKLEREIVISVILKHRRNRKKKGNFGRSLNKI